MYSASEIEWLHRSADRCTFYMANDEECYLLITKQVFNNKALYSLVRIGKQVITWHDEETLNFIPAESFTSLLVGRHTVDVKREVTFEVKKKLNIVNLRGEPLYSDPHLCIPSVDIVLPDVYAYYMLMCHRHGSKAAKEMTVEYVGLVCNYYGNKPLWLITFLTGSLQALDKITTEEVVELSLCLNKQEGEILSKACKKCRKDLSEAIEKL